MARSQKPSRDIEKVVLTFQEAQEFLGISHQTLYRLMDEGLPSHNLCRRRVFLKEELIQWVREH